MNPPPTAVEQPELAVALGSVRPPVTAFAGGASIVPDPPFADLDADADLDPDPDADEADDDDANWPHDPEWPEAGTDADDPDDASLAPGAAWVIALAGVLLAVLVITAIVLNA